MGKQEFSVPLLANKITTEADAYLLLEQLRWDGEPACPHCGAIDGHYYIRPLNGASRRTRTGSMSQRRVWRCHACRKQFSVLTGTIFHGSKIPLRTWLFVIFEMCASKNGVAAREVERKYDLTAKTAWFMLHRIREAMKRDPLAGLLSGAVQADETWIGGDPKNRHRNDPREQTRAPGTSDKTAVFSLLHYETREVRSRVVPDVTGQTLLPALEEQAKLSSTWLQTDGGAAYKTIAGHVADHQWVNHDDGQYVGPGAVGTNVVEGYFSQLKRSIDGTHHHVSTVHLPRYLAQFDFMYSHCRRTDSARMRRLIGQTAGRRLTYKPLTSS
jgi:transposase-like protein